MPNRPIDKRVGRRLIGGVLLLCALLTAVVWGVAVAYLHFDHESTLRAHQQQLQGLSRAVERHVARTFENIDHTLLHLRQQYQQNPQGFGSSLGQFLPAAFLQVHQVGVIDAQGWAVFSSLGLKEKIDLSDRQHFRFHRDGQDDVMFVSQPVFGRVSKKWSLQFTRRIQAKDGTFLGVMVISVSPEQFSDFFASLDIPEGSAIAMVGRDRVVRVRASNPPILEGAVGKAVPGQLDYFSDPSITNGVKMLGGVFDNVPRLLVYRQAGSYPMLITVSHSVEHIFADYQQRRVLALSLTGSINLCILTACAALIWLVRRQIRIQRDLEQSRQILSQQTQELARSNAELESFAYVASHDLREPLRMVSSYLRLIERRLEHRLDQDIRDFIGFAVTGAERMDRLILDLLEYSRVGRSPHVPEPVNLGEILHACAPLFQDKLAELSGHLTLPPSGPLVMGQRDELLRLFQNLISNAIKYRHPDMPPEIVITVQTAGNSVLLTISDNGIGIEAQYFDRIFVIFQRLHGRDHYEGTGIGLALCKKIVSQHNGQIWVTSVPGQGSTFYVELPVLAAP